MLQRAIWKHNLQTLSRKTWCPLPSTIWNCDIELICLYKCWIVAQHFILARVGSGGAGKVAYVCVSGGGGCFLFNKNRKNFHWFETCFMYYSCSWLHKGNLESNCAKQRTGSFLLKALDNIPLWMEMYSCIQICRFVFIQYHAKHF